MRFIVMVKANKDSEAGVLPDEKILTAMGKYNEELVKAGVLLAAEGLHPSSKGARVKFSGAKRTVIDGPFTEVKELIDTRAHAAPRARRRVRPRIGAAAAAVTKARLARCTKRSGEANVTELARPDRHCRIYR